MSPIICFLLTAYLSPSVELYCLPKQVYFIVLEPTTSGFANLMYIQPTVSTIEYASRTAGRLWLLASLDNLSGIHLVQIDITVNVITGDIQHYPNTRLTLKGTKPEQCGSARTVTPIQYLYPIKRGGKQHPTTQRITTRKMFWIKSLPPLPTLGSLVQSQRTQSTTWEEQPSPHSPSTSVHATNCRFSI